MWDVRIRAMYDELRKHAFQVSQFSGPLSMGSFKMTSHQPGFRDAGPSVKVVDAPMLALDPRAGVPAVKVAAGMGTSISSVTSPARVLRRTQQVGTAQVTAQAGPSIASQVKPVNFGKGSAIGPSIPGATK